MSQRVIKFSRTHPEELRLQQTLQHLVAAFPLRLLFQDALQEDPDLSDLGVRWEQIHGLEKPQNMGLFNTVHQTLLVLKENITNLHYEREPLRIGWRKWLLSEANYTNWKSIIYEN